MGQEWLKTPETEPKETKIIRSISFDYGAESRVHDVTPRKNSKRSFAKGRRSKTDKSKTVTDTTVQLQVIGKSQSTLRTPRQQDTPRPSPKCNRAIL